ncbi:MAG: bifunctional 5,10-methylenetetrahydrofolate dehydrogenase/5,10-methenyltetrahydrofolate cyclohydrolase [Candidatus Dojkabacteria bacterium]
MKIIDGKKISKEILEGLKNKIESSHVRPKLAIVLVSNDPASKTYTDLKTSRAEEIGIVVNNYEFDLTSTDLRNEVISKIKELNNDDSVNGILLQLPLDESIKDSTDEIVDTIDPDKDVDGLTSASQRKLADGIRTFVPATVEAVIECIKYTCPKELLGEGDQLSYLGTFLQAKRIVIINDSKLIGKPLFSLLSRYNGSIEVLNKYTDDIGSITKQADILVTATGQTQIIDASMVKNSCTIIDITSVKKNDTILGDVTISKELEEKVEWITPVPGGVGPITIACLLRNLVNKAVYLNSTK